MPDRLRLAVCLAAFGGLRIGEWRALRRRDITLSSKGYYVVKVERQAQRVNGRWLVTEPKSMDGIRSVALPTWLSEYVEPHLAEHVGRFPDSLLFESGGGSAFIERAWETAWNKARDAAGVRKSVREHDLRHYYATNQARAGLSAPRLKAVLGHADISTSMGYVAAVQEADFDAADNLRPLPHPAPEPVTQLARRA